MAFLSEKKDGIVYVFKFELEDCVVYKIGISAREEVYDRLAEVVMSMIKLLRYIPRTTMKKFSKSTRYRDIEKILHEEFAEFKYEWGKKISGHTEYFSGIDEEKLLLRYEELMNIEE